MMIVILLFLMTQGVVQAACEEMNPFERFLACVQAPGALAQEFLRGMERVAAEEGGVIAVILKQGNGINRTLRGVLWDVGGITDGFGRDFGTFLRDRVMDSVTFGEEDKSARFSTFVSPEIWICIRTLLASEEGNDARVRPLSGAARLRAQDLPTTVSCWKVVSQQDMNYSSGLFLNFSGLLLRGQ